MTFQRMRIYSPRAVRAVLAVGCLLPAAVAAQNGSVSAVVMETDHELLTSRLTGAAAHVSFPIHSGPVSIRVGAERLGGTSHRIGAPCAGLVQPGTCQPEPMRDDGLVVAGTAGLGIQVIAWRRIVFDLTGDLSFVNVQVDSRGLTSGGTISAGKELWDGDIGVEGTWFPWTRLPVALAVGVAGGRFSPVVSHEEIDGYTPFESGFYAVRVRVGAAWRPSLP
jgi:hypothetical protein